MRSPMARRFSSWSVIFVVIAVLALSIGAHAQVPVTRPVRPVVCRIANHIWSCAREGGRTMLSCNRFTQCWTTLAEGSHGFVPSANFASLLRTTIEDPAQSHETADSLLDVLRRELRAAGPATDAEFGAPVRTAPAIVMPRLRHISEEGAEVIHAALELLATGAPIEYARFVREIRTVAYRPGTCGGPEAALACTGGDLGRTVVLEWEPESGSAQALAVTLAHEAHHHETVGGVHRVIEGHDVARDQRLEVRLMAAAVLALLGEGQPRGESLGLGPRR